MSTAPDLHALLDDGFAPASCDVLVIGCGNILRADDAVGPILIRHLWERGVPGATRMVDGGTAGMDVAFQMRGARRVVIVDASSTGSEPGTIFRVPGEELGELTPIDGLHTHAFRWDHALSFSRWLLGPECPNDITVFLIEAGDLTPGAQLSPPVQEAMERVAVMVRDEFFPDVEIDDAATVEVTQGGYLRIPLALAEQYFPGDACGLALEQGATGDELLLVPLQSTANGGQLLKRRNAAGDRVLLVRETLSDDLPVGQHRTRWDESRGALVVDLEPKELVSDGRQR
ncbi:hydrogenase maturation protease [Microbacterium sp.]|uniref:hydrogenase maturation protease n=1 Tax=Microbacterium sp. TaxID=51671 RepID=UPI002736E208|nr:hydrogenase maturation protease [Microbacterium sp.]MDP3950186.1 hydrogenase maturation protease [Microbacterium sp.]